MQKVTPTQTQTKSILQPTKESSASAVQMYRGAKSSLILVIAKSGRGKTTAIENLDPKTNFIINVMGKNLPFINAMQYKEGENLFIDSNPQTIRMIMQKVSKDERFNTLCIDDGQYIMATEFMDKALVKGYDKFSTMARNMWEILILANKLRSGLKIFFLTHEEDTGAERKMKTLGKLLDEKITCEGLATIVLFGDTVVDSGIRKYFFATQSDGITNAKSPRGMFPSQIPNDLNLVSRRIDEYYSGIPLEKSKLDFSF